MRERADEVLEQIDAVNLVNKPVGEMSAGQQRRIMIGRALVGSSQMLLLDEPSNALDISAQRELRNLLRKLAQQGTGILLITHHIADIIPEIDRILLLRDGRIIGDGPKSRTAHRTHSQRSLPDRSPAHGERRLPSRLVSHCRQIDCSAKPTCLHAHLLCLPRLKLPSGGVG